MAGNVRGAMRPQGRSPPFLLIGLCVALCILGFHYWSLSSRNRELSAQILNLQEQERRSMSKRLTAERRSATVVEEMKKCETSLDSGKNEIARKESEVMSLAEQLKNKVTETTECETRLKEIDEVKKNLKSCEENKVGINQELQKTKDELQKALQHAPVQDSDHCKLCKSQWVEEKKTFLSNVEKVLGPTALIHLRDAGIDIGQFAHEIDAHQKPKVELPNSQTNGQSLQINSNNNANGQANNPNPAQDQSALAQPALNQNQHPNLPAEQPAQGQPAQGQPAQGQPAQGQLVQGQPAQGKPAVVMDQNVQNNNVPQGQPIQGNPPNPPVAAAAAAGGNVETNVHADGAQAQNADGAQAQNAVPNNPPEQRPGDGFVPVANPGVDIVGQLANQIPVANPGNKPDEHDVAAANRVEVPPSDMNKTTAGISLTGLNKLNMSLPKEALSAPNLSLSSRPPTQSVQTDPQAALHASQSNITANNQTLDLRFGQSPPPQANMAEATGQNQFKQNAGFGGINENDRKSINPDSSKILQGGIVQDEDSIELMQQHMKMEEDRFNHMKNTR